MNEEEMDPRLDKFLRYASRMREDLKFESLFISGTLDPGVIYMSQYGYIYPNFVGMLRSMRLEDLTINAILRLIESDPGAKKMNDTMDEFHNIVDNYGKKED